MVRFVTNLQVEERKQTPAGEEEMHQERSEPGKEDEEKKMVEDAKRREAAVKEKEITEIKRKLLWRKLL